jgi:hypothetical protein
MFHLKNSEWVFPDFCDFPLLFSQKFADSGEITKLPKIFSKIKWKLVWIHPFSDEQTLQYISYILLGIGFL